MSHSFKLSRRIARFRVPALAVLMVVALACDDNDSFSPINSSQPDAADIDSPGDDSRYDEESELQAATVDQPVASSSFAGGVPFGLSAQPNDEFGSVYNGSLRIIGPGPLLKDLAAIKARGGKVVINLAGGASRYTDRNGQFNLSKWKHEVDRFRNIKWDSYIKDGTVIGHYMIDEPHHANRWGGKPVSGETLEEMARYSKERYPDLPTIARTYPWYLEKWGPYRHLDAAWAAYVHRFGDVDRYIDEEVSSAKKQGLALVVGLNVLKGGPNKRPMTGSQIKEWGSALLNTSYACAFISWKHSNSYLRSKSVKDAMSYLRNKAERMSHRSCRGS